MGHLLTLFFLFFVWNAFSWSIVGIMASASSLPPWSVDVWSPLAWFAWFPCLWLSVHCSHDNRPPSPWPCLPILAAGTLWLIWAPLLSESRLFLLPRTLPSFSSMWMV